MSETKERSDSIAARLSRIDLGDGVTAFDQVRDWLSLESMHYETAIEKIAEEYGLSTSKGALVKFYQKHCTGFKNKRAREHAAEVRALLEAQPDINFTELTLKQIEQRAFEEAFAKDADIDGLGKLSKILEGSARLQLQQRRLELDVNKWRSAVKTDVEKGLDALQEEIKGNAEALKLFNQMKAIFIKSVEGTEG